MLVIVLLAQPLEKFDTRCDIEIALARGVRGVGLVTPHVGNDAEAFDRTSEEVAVGEERSGELAEKSGMGKGN